MSAYVPFEIQVEIIKKVPVKSLLRFTSVSKQWKSLIHSSDFITDHSVNQTQPDNLLLRYNENYEYKYVSIVDDDSFPQHKFVPTVPPTVKLVTSVRILDCSHGLVFLYGFARDLVPGKNLIVLWNPSIRKSVGIVLPHAYTTVGFGVCPKTSDPTIVTITYPPWKVQVYTLSSRVWRSIPINLCVPPKSVACFYKQAVLDGVIYWVAYNSLPESGYQIISFDLTSEEFGEVDLPDSLRHARNFRRRLSISKLKGSLVVLEYYNDNDKVCDVWMMTKHDGLKSSFAKIFTVGYKANDGCLLNFIPGFRKNGQVIREHQCVCDDNSIVTTLEAYEPSTKHTSDLGIYVASHSFFKMTSYTESLLLLNHSNSITADDDHISSCIF